MKKFIHILIAALLFNCTIWAQSSGDYRSVNSGNWNDATKWEIHNGSNWVTTPFYPGQNHGTGSVTISTNIKLTETVPHPISSLYIESGYNQPPSGILSFSAQNAVSLVVSASVTIFGELRVDDQEGAKKHSLSIGATLWVGDMFWDYDYYYTPTFFQTINQDDELHLIFNTTFYESSVWSGSMSSISFQDVTFNGIGISLLQINAFVNGHANFINGIVSGEMTFGDDATHSGASATSYATSVTKYGNDPFTFPIGDDGVYAPLTISAPAGLGTSVTAGYKRTNALSLGPISDPGLFTVSNCEYWLLDHNSNNLNVTANWGVSSGCGSSPYVNNVSEVTLAHFGYATQRWDSHGGSGTGTTTNGSVTWNGVTAPGYFTLGNLLSVCNAPTVVASNITSNSATLSWSPISGAASYDIDYKSCLSNIWINAATATTSTSVVLSGLSAATCYDWRIRTNCSISSSSYEQGQFRTLCAIPTGLSTSNITNTTATLNWSAVPAAYYTVAYKRSTSSTWITSVTGINSLSYTLTGLSGSTSYDWKVYLTSCYSSSPGNYAQASFTTVCTDIYEPNNTSNQAKTISIGSTISAGISSTADVDWLKITTPNNNNTNLQVNLYNLPADYDLNIYNKSLKLVGSSLNSGTSNEIVSYNSNARNATYYIKVIGKNGAYNISQCYNLLVHVSNTPNSASSKSYPTNEVTEISDKGLLYPNPASEFVFLNFNSATVGLVNLQIVNNLGQVVKEYPVNRIKGHNQIKVQVDDIKPGMYVLRMKKGELNIVRKFIIAR